MKRLILILAVLLLVPSLCWAAGDIDDRDIDWGSGTNQVDADDLPVVSGGWSNLSPASDFVQKVFDWIDTNWDGAGTSYWARVGTVLSPKTAGDTCELQQTSTTGSALKVRRNLHGGDTDAPVVYFANTDADDGQHALRVVSNATGVSAVHINGVPVALSATASGPACAGILGYGATDNNSHGVASDDRTKVGDWADFDEQNAGASPTFVSPAAQDGRLGCTNDDWFTWVNDAGKAYSYADADGDTQIHVEESADEDQLRFDTGGTERVVIDSDGINCTGTVEASGCFTIDTTPGIDSSVDLLSDVDIAAQTGHSYTLTFEGGLLTVVTDNGWVSVPISPP